MASKHSYLTADSDGARRGKARRWLFSLLLCAIAVPGFAQTLLSLKAGWTLLGNGGAAPIEVATTFGNDGGVSSVWKWNRNLGVWAFFAPSLANPDLAAYAQGKGYEVLSRIEPKEGFWINTSTDLALTLPFSDTLALTEADLLRGWNLVAGAGGKTPSQLYQALLGSMTPLGKAMVSAWGWDTANGRWKFYAPSLEAQGSSALSDYVSAKAYQQFTGPLGVTEGFWLNVGAAAATDNGSPGLKAFASPTAFESYLKAALERSVGSTSLYDTVAIAAAASSNGGATTTTGFSTTNLQEAGVDEADRLKSDGSYLFVLNQDGTTAESWLDILALAALSPPRASPIAHLPLDPQKSWAQAYLATNRPGSRPDVLLALGEARTYYSPGPGLPMPVAASERNWFAPAAWRQGQVELQWVNITDRSKPQAAGRLGIDGFLVASRRIGETVFLVARFSPSIPPVGIYTGTGGQATAEKLAIQQALFDTLLPKWYIDGVAQGNLLTAEKCFKAPGDEARGTPDLIVVAAIDLDQPRAMPRAQCLTGTSEAAYMSQEALYVATTRFGYATAIGQSATGTTAVIASYPADYATDLHKFALTAAGPQYRGSGSVAGHLGWEQDKKSFRMGEYQGDLRIVTSLGEDWGGTATSRLSVLREQAGSLALVAELPNKQRPATLGKAGEKLYAARFIGKRGYLVTFRITDPLYVLDLADPADPRIAGELQMPGYSDYLHPIGDQWLLGVGKDAVPDTPGALGDGRGAWYQGVKLALFNVADPARPSEVNSLIIGKRGTQSQALQDHHAFTYLAIPGGTDELMRIALPVERHVTAPAYNSYPAGDPRTYYDWTDTGLYLFSVGPAGIVQRGEVRVDQRTATHTYPSSTWAGDRALLRSNEVHYLHGSAVWSASWPQP